MMYKFSYVFNNQTYYFRILEGRVSSLNIHEIPMNFSSAYDIYFIDDILFNRMFHRIKDLSFENVNCVFQFSLIYPNSRMLSLHFHFNKNKERLFSINQNNVLV